MIKDVASKIQNFEKTNWYHSDQEFLKQVIYPEIKDNVLVHDDWNAKPFPMERQDYQFVGQVFDENDNTILEHIEILRRAL